MALEDRAHFVIIIEWWWFIGECRSLNGLFMSKEFCPPPFLTLDLGLEHQCIIWVISNKKLITWLNLGSCPGLGTENLRACPNLQLGSSWFCFWGQDPQGSRAFTTVPGQAADLSSGIQNQKQTATTAKGKNGTEGGWNCFFVMEYYEKIKVKVIFKHQNQVKRKKQNLVSWPRFFSGGTED